MTRKAIIVIALLFVATTAMASWYDDYDKGLKALNSGDYAGAIARLTAAINAHPNEGPKERTYGAIFINYRPYYYRGVANLNKGNYQAALDDLEKTSGPGEMDMGSVETLVARAKSKLEQGTTPAPQPPTPQPPTPQPPSIDPALRRRANEAVQSALEALNEARGRNPNSPQFATAANAFADLNKNAAAANSNEALNRVINEAPGVVALARLVVPQPVIPTPVPPTPTPGPKPVIPKPDRVTDDLLREYRTQLREALANYFAGEFEESSRQLEILSVKLPDNPWIYAFLGASQYSQYAFEADEAYKNAAMESFRKAKSLRDWKGGLPQKYFSKRIRKVFDTAG